MGVEIYENHKIDKSNGSKMSNNNNEARNTNTLSRIPKNAKRVNISQTVKIKPDTRVSILTYNFAGILSR